jgi:hypothetical protein
MATFFEQWTAPSDQIRPVGDWNATNIPRRLLEYHDIDQSSIPRQHSTWSKVEVVHRDLWVEGL